MSWACCRTSLLWSAAAAAVADLELERREEGLLGGKEKEGERDVDLAELGLTSPSLLNPLARSAASIPTARPSPSPAARPAPALAEVLAASCSAADPRRLPPADALGAAPSRSKTE